MFYAFHRLTAVIFIVPLHRVEGLRLSCCRNKDEAAQTVQEGTQLVTEHTGFQAQGAAKPGTLSPTFPTTCSLVFFYPSPLVKTLTLPHPVAWFC